MAKKIVKIKIDGKEYKATEGQTILDVAKNNNIFLPTLCEHPDLEVKANCRVCVVEIKGRKSLATSCSTKVMSGMEVSTKSKAVVASRNSNISMIFAEHIEKCADCTMRYNCQLLDLAKRYKLKINNFKDRKSDRKTYKFGPAVEIDGSQCIDCRNCVEACSTMQNINYLEIKGKGCNQEIVPTKNKDSDCIYCGQCALHCPVAAAQEQYDWDKVEPLLKKKNKIMIAQFAPSVRVTIGEEFGLPYGAESSGKVVAGLKKLGFDYVFDVNFGADMTTVVEATELIERLNDKKAVLPMITSCCPAWVKYVEYFRPDLIPNLTSSRSPQMHMAGVIKTYWAKKMKVRSQDIVVVSVMPCTAKKFECRREEMKIDGMWPVDYVITTRELAFMLKKNNLDFKKLKPQVGDLVFNNGTGAAAIYGSSGGVMESALRTANAMICQGKKAKECPVSLEFKAVRGQADIKEATVNIAGTDLKVAVVSGIGHVGRVINNLKDYHYIEVMACPGGCIGGGGQPIPTTKAIRKKRMDSLYAIDKTRKLRRAHENKEVMESLEWLEDNKLSHKILHTKYIKRK